MITLFHTPVTLLTILTAFGWLLVTLGFVYSTRLYSTNLPQCLYLILRPYLQQVFGTLKYKCFLNLGSSSFLVLLSSSISSSWFAVHAASSAKIIIWNNFSEFFNSLWYLRMNVCDLLFYYHLHSAQRILLLREFPLFQRCRDHCNLCNCWCHNIANCFHHIFQNFVFIMKLI